MKYLYKEFEMNGVFRIGEKTVVSDETPNASIIDVNDLCDAEGLEQYRLVDGEPVKVGPRPRSAAEIEVAVSTRVNAEYSAEKREELREKAINCFGEGKTPPSDYKAYKDRKDAIRAEIIAAEEAKKY